MAALGCLGGWVGGQEKVLRVEVSSERQAHREQLWWKKEGGEAVFTAAPFTTARTWQQPMSTSRGTDKEDVLRVYDGILLSHKGAQNCNLQRHGET